MAARVSWRAHGLRHDHAGSEERNAVRRRHVFAAETTFAIFVGGVIRWLTDRARDKRGFNDAQKARVENAGILTASGMIAGEAILGLVVAAFYFFNKPLPVIFAQPATISGFIVLVVLALVMIYVPLKNAGRPEDPAPPTAIM